MKRLMAIVIVGVFAFLALFGNNDAVQAQGGQSGTQVAIVTCGLSFGVASPQDRVDGFDSTEPVPVMLQMPCSEALKILRDLGYRYITPNWYADAPTWTKYVLERRRGGND